MARQPDQPRYQQCITNKFTRSIAACVVTGEGHDTYTTQYQAFQARAPLDFDHNTPLASPNCTAAYF